jgi:hypothetical protein
MRLHHDPASLTPQERFAELAGILAAGLSRALRRPTSPAGSEPQKSPDSAEVSLELPRDTVLSVLTGKRPRDPETPS